MSQETSHPACLWPFSLLLPSIANTASPVHVLPSSAPLQEEFQAGFSHSPQHCYMVYPTHKAYAIHSKQHQLFLILKPGVPTFALRSLATRTLQALTAEDLAF